MKKEIYNNFILYYLFKKKKKKKIYNTRLFINNFNFFKIIFFFNIYLNLEDKYENEFFFQKYYYMKNFWYLFLNFYNIYYKNLKINIKNFFNSYILKFLGKRILSLNTVKNQISYNFNSIYIKLQDIFKNNRCNKLIKWKKKISINFCIKKNFRNLINKFIKIRIPFFFFNKKKKNLLKYLVFFFSKCFIFDINRNEYVHFWIRFYKYTLKRIFVYFSYIFRKLFFFLFVIYKSFKKMLNWKKNVNKLEFMYFFFSKMKKGIFFKNFKLYSIFDNVYKLLNLKFYNKKNYNVYYFLIKKKKKISKKIKFELVLFSKFIKFKIYEFIKLSFYIIFFKTINNWMNTFLQLFNINNLHHKHFFLKLNQEKKGLNIFFNKVKKREHLIFLKKNYYVYDNITKI